MAHFTWDTRNVQNVGAIGNSDGALDMRPGYSTNDGIDGHDGDAKFIGQSLLSDAASSISLANVNDLGVSELGLTVRRSNHPRWIVMAGPALRKHIRDIDGGSTKEQMRGVDARRVIATMTDIEAVGDRAMIQLIGHAMRIEMPATIGLVGHSSIALVVQMPLPRPAFIATPLLHVRPKAVGQRCSSVSTASTAEAPEAKVDLRKQYCKDLSAAFATAFDAWPGRTARRGRRINSFGHDRPQ